MSSQYDPRLRLQIKELLFNTFYETINQRFINKVNQLIEKNVAMCFYNHHSFMFRNVLYQNDPAQPPRPANRLHPSLIPTMVSYLDDMHFLNTEEIPFIQGYFSRVLNLFPNLEDSVELLPESLQPVMARFISNYPSTAPRVSLGQLQQAKIENQPYLMRFKQYMVLHLIR